MLIEMHAHTSEHSNCSNVRAVDLIRRLHAKGFDGLVITDHHYLWEPEEIREVKRNSAVPDTFLVFSGQEVSTRDTGDVLVYGADSTIAPGSSLPEIRTRYPEAALVLAHPYRNGRSPAPDHLLNPHVDAVEIFNSNHTVSENSRGLKDWRRHKFTAIGGTDTHGASYAGTYPTVFDHPLESMTALAEALKKGRCHPFLKRLPKNGALLQVAEIMGGGVPASQERIVIKSADGSDHWKAAERAYRIMETLYDNGFHSGRYRVPRPIDRDEQSMTLMEEELDGRSLHEAILTSDLQQARFYVQLAALWLARLHNSRLQLTAQEEFIQREEKRLHKYVSHFEECGHSHTRRARELMKEIYEAEAELFRERPDLLIQAHGDYHPKNIYIVQEKPGDAESLYVAAIDFDSSYRLPGAYDVGTFLAQFRNQLFAFPGILKNIPEEVFLNSYVEAARGLSPDFGKQIELFRARTCLSIASYLIKLGLGDSENLYRVLVEAENSMAQYTA